MRWRLRAQSERSRRDGRPPRSPMQHERRQRRHLVLVMLMLALALWSILVVHLPTTPGLQSGRPSPMDIRARRTISFVSNLLTDQERFRIENSDDYQVYDHDSAIL